jgi:hypothetical protein
MNSPTFFYVWQNLAAFTAATGLDENDTVKYNQNGDIGAQLYHLGQDPVRQIGTTEEGEAITEVCEGYHVNSTRAINAWAAYRVKTVNNPINLFA